MKRISRVDYNSIAVKLQVAHIANSLWLCAAQASFVHARLPFPLIPSYVFLSFLFYYFYFAFQYVPRETYPSRHEG